MRAEPRAANNARHSEVAQDILGLRYRPLPHRTVLVYEPAAARQPAQ
jgi:hypothetical protein